MDEKYLQMLHPVTAVVHWKVLSILKRYDIKTILDVGGVGKLEALSDYLVNDVNIQDGVDGCDLPFEDNSFDAVVSIATLEHVTGQKQFLDECLRVAKRVNVHWFPLGTYAVEVERLKKKYGHWHPCTIPVLSAWIYYGEIEEFVSCGEHLLLCMTLTPSLKTPEVYDYVIKNYDMPYGTILIREK